MSLKAPSRSSGESLSGKKACHSPAVLRDDDGRSVLHVANTLTQSRFELANPECGILTRHLTPSSILVLRYKEM